VTGAGTLGSVPATPSPQPSGLRAKLGGLIREVSKFGTVGGIAFAVDLTIFNILLQVGSETLLAKTISTVIATTLAFLGNRFWTWRHRDHHHMARQYTTFFLLNAVGLGIGLTCLAISHYGLGQIWPALQTPLADNISGQLVGTALGTLFRFWSYRRFVFPEAARDEGEPTAQERAVVPRM
jgi:putative flippase GtrA